RGSPMLAGARGESTQCLFKILQQVLGRLDPDRQAQQRIPDAEAQAIFAREPGVRGGRRPSQQCMHAAEARRNDENAHLAGKLIGAARRALELEAQYAAEAGEQAAGARMSRMRLETGVIDARDRRVAFEKPRDPERAVVLV